MKSNSSGLSAAIPSVPILGSLYIIEFSLVLTAMAIYKRGDRPLFVFLLSHAGIVFLFAVLALITSALVIVLLLRKGVPAGSYRFAPTLVLNLWSVILIFAAAEIVIRVSLVNTPTGPKFANTLLLPRSWEDFAAHHRAILARASTWGSYFVYDSMLGWTVGRSRRSENNLYFSSLEGIRSPRVAMTFAGIPARHRIAIVGDSFTFGLEVQYEGTWGHHLERMLGSEYQVLNFGVDGYGVDQAYLRYQRDVLPWRPDIVVLGMINDDFYRTMGVYGFLKFIDSEMPFPKPRFVLREKIVPLNLPLPTPDEIFAKKSITELPFIAYDASFQRDEWMWHFYHYAYSIRFLLSKFPHWPVPEPNDSEDTLKSVNGEILRAFVRLARERGSTPVVVYFPSRSDFASDGTPLTGLRRIGQEVLQASGIAYLDMTDCVSKVRPTERFAIRHYSPATNAVVAGCLVDSIHGSR
jgi:GDSL-like Lipase/Acylhydrolase family